MAMGSLLCAAAAGAVVMPQARVLPFAGMVTGSALVFLGRYASIKGRRTSRANECQDIAEKGTERAPVVYLRRFDEDEKTARVPLPLSMPLFVSTSTEEEQLVRVLSEIGPVVALARPGERLPRLGARRLEVDSAEWRSTVESLVTRARLVVLRAGSLTDSLRFELESATRLVRPDHLVILVTKSRRVAEAFLGELAEVSRTGVPTVSLEDDEVVPIGTLAGYVYFTKQRKAIWVPLDPAPLHRRSITRPLESTYKLSFRPVFEQLGVAWTPPRTSWGFVLFLGGGIILVTLMFLVAMVAF